MDFIYALGSPITGDIYYVGRTAKPSQRWTEHCKRTGNYSRLGLKPVMLILERDTKEPAAAEKRWIMAMRTFGYTLTNGGEKVVRAL